jgi:hypothetical protein
MGWIAAGPLPGKSLVVYDPVLRLPIDVFLFVDGHAQERSLLKIILTTIENNDAWVADRNFCTVEFTSVNPEFQVQKAEFQPGRENLPGWDHLTGEAFSLFLKIAFHHATILQHQK